ncbi:MAG: hypothetical protein QOH06_2213 [Acidobacteriota bacterium]|jgi:photosystem II stability/assembly factor-like uncharacterized protein|nr:hypothetical protein [Acidobacteriota bacterium]
MSVRTGVSIRLGLFLLCLSAVAVSTAQPPRRPIREDYPHGGHDFFRLRRAPVGKLAIPVDLYFEAMRRMRVMRGHSLRRGDFLPSREELVGRGISYAAADETLGAWSPLGPGNVGGRTRALIVDPKSPKTLFAGGVAGGVWKTTDGGLSWTPLDDLAPNLAIGSLAMDPSNSNIVYAGTGEGFFNEDAVRGAGIFKTTDGGITWERLASTANPFFFYVNDIVVSRHDPRRVYAATRTGVWRSKDRGRTWSRVLSPKVYGGCLDLAIRTDRKSDSLLAACGTRKGTSAVWANDAAERRGGWEKVLSEPDMGRTTLAIAPSDQDVVYALASTNASGNFYWGLHAVFRSDNSGRSWSAQVRNTDPNRLNRLLLTNAYFALTECSGEYIGFYNQGWYDNAIAVDPVNPDRVWAGGIDLFRSDDAGKSWGLMSYWWGDTKGYVHADQHALVFHPEYDGATNRTLFVANDGGLFTTQDALAPPVTSAAAVCTPEASQSDWGSLNNGYGVTQFYHGMPYPDGAKYFGGSQDTGVVRGSGDPNWDVLVPGDAGYVAVNPDDTDVLYASLTNLSINKSTDGWENYADATSGIDTGDKFLFVTPFLLDPSDPKRLWTGGAHMWRTNDAAGSWSKASDQLTGSVSALAVSSDPDRVLAGTSEGNIHRTSSARTSTADTAWPSAQPRKGFVSSVAFDPNDPAVAYATYSNFGGIHVWKSADGGATWAGIDGKGIGALPDLPVNAIAVDPVDSRHLYLATDLGVFISRDGGANWLVENTGFANVITSWLTVLKGAGNTRTLFAFTHGRGAWKITLEN